MTINAAPTDLSTGIVVVQVHKCPRRVATLGAPLSGVDKRLGEGAAVSDVVRAAGPLEALSGGARLFHGSITAAAVEETGAAGSRDGVRDAGCRDGMDERCFPGTCKQQRHASHSHPASHRTTHEGHDKGLVYRDNTQQFINFIKLVASNNCCLYRK